MMFALFNIILLAVAPKILIELTKANHMFLSVMSLTILALYVSVSGDKGMVWGLFGVVATYTDTTGMVRDTIYKITGIRY